MEDKIYFFQNTNCISFFLSLNNQSYYSLYFFGRASQHWMLAPPTGNNRSSIVPPGGRGGFGISFLISLTFQKPSYFLPHVLRKIKSAANNFWLGAPPVSQIVFLWRFFSSRRQTSKINVTKSARRKKAVSNFPKYSIAKENF